MKVFYVFEGIMGSSNSWKISKDKRKRKNKRRYCRAVKKINSLSTISFVFLAIPIDYSTA